MPCDMCAVLIRYVYQPVLGPMNPAGVFAPFAIQIQVSTANVIPTYIDQWITTVSDKWELLFVCNKFDLTSLDLKALQVIDTFDLSIYN